MTLHFLGWHEGRGEGALHSGITPQALYLIWLPQPPCKHKWLNLLHIICCPNQEWTPKLNLLFIIKILHIQSKIFNYAKWHMMKGKIPLSVTWLPLMGPCHRSSHLTIYFTSLEKLFIYATTPIYNVFVKNTQMRITRSILFCHLLF